MIRCELCEGFVPAHSGNCPNCLNLVGQSTKSKAYRQARMAATVAGASIISMTLMACYGAPPDYLERHLDMDSKEPCSEEEPKSPSKDKDPRKIINK